MSSHTFRLQGDHFQVSESAESVTAAAFRKLLLSIASTTTQQWPNITDKQLPSPVYEDLEEETRHVTCPKCLLPINPSLTQYDTKESCSPTPSLSPSPFVPEQTPYELGQEVHLLDPNQTEQTGLTTYVIVDKTTTDQKASYNMYHSPPTAPEPTTNKSTENTIYILQPCQTPTFRTVHSRLIPVGYPLGAEVKQSNNIVPAIIIRRTVCQGNRMYDVKDASGNEWLSVPEEQLEWHQGGDFEFRWVE